MIAPWHLKNAEFDFETPPRRKIELERIRCRICKPAKARGKEGSGVVLNLASQEYFAAVKGKLADVRAWRFSF